MFPYPEVNVKKKNSVHKFVIHPLCPSTGWSCTFGTRSCLRGDGTSIWLTYLIGVNGQLDFSENFT